jgi:hypothetical protein
MQEKSTGGIALLSYILLSGLALSALWSLNSCQKNTNCVAIVKIVDTAGNPCAGALVSLQYNIVVTPPQTITRNLGTTDQTGTVQYTFKDPAIYDVDVTYHSKTDTLNPPIKLQIGGTVSQTYTFK